MICFGAILAPLLEVKIGLGGTSYLDFVTSMHLPLQLARVDPIVASFCGGGVGAVSALLVVELNNVKKQQRNRCHYCEGTGYLPCGHCVGSGIDPATRCPCAYCAGTSKVMCTGCLCTGKSMATEHDPRFDPF
ncbi:chaperone dnaJ [Raphidocelis subcapitata]|uniref:Chaperone dnaJ n=1 Tax=Raphidocelis subcapitata TaxID=307507 RepID=A0A2V0PFY5_9CHLO|nr:chaperone dnaJ [Raphidocelis subcapitata]|eukprot:GBF98764.1 chaperone dnaJ [Raphidocelis subcapitata]